MKIMQYPALHKYHIKETGVPVHIDFHNVTDFIADLHAGSFGCFNRVFLIGFGNVKDRYLRSEKCKRNCFLAAGSAYIGDPDAIKTIEVVCVLLLHPLWIRFVLGRSFFRRPGSPDPEIVCIKLPGLFML